MQKEFRQPCKARLWLSALLIQSTLTYFAYCAYPASSESVQASPLSAPLAPTNTNINSNTTPLSNKESAQGQAPFCKKPIYLTFDTGHMEVAPLISDVLRKNNVRVTYFAAQERTKTGDGSLGDTWASWWRREAQLGNTFASHTYDHVYWSSDLPGNRFLFKPSSGPLKGQTLNWGANEYCDELKKSNQRLKEITGIEPLPLFRAPGGKVSTQLLNAAKSCGFEHVDWASAGFLGDELSSKDFSNAFLLSKALKGIQTGDILMAHLGIWSRQDPWAPTDLEPLITGLKERGFCFESLTRHPRFKDWISLHPKSY
jgi:peptidoglycan/xylan/chitin deacetylase (PgdA/CDA1 family)